MSTDVSTGPALSAFEALVEYGRKRQKEKWFLPDEDSKPELLRFIKKTTQELIMVVGELDPKLYENPEMVAACRGVLDKGASIQVVFNANVETIEEVNNHLIEANPSWVQMKREYGDRLKLWWVPKRPRQHYAVADGRHLFLEEPDHIPYEPRDALFRYDDHKFSKEWQEHFGRYVNRKAREVIFD